MITRLLRWLWCPGPCKFKDVGVVKQYWDDPDKEKAPMYRIFIQKCETCGNMRSYKF